jgi:hypothetical protein
MPSQQEVPFNYLDDIGVMSQGRSFSRTGLCGVAAVIESIVIVSTAVLIYIGESEERRDR